MTGRMNFEWRPQPVQDGVSAACARVLGRIETTAFDWWVVFVPVRTGFLRDSWFSDVHETTSGWLLLFGATAPYAIYVEVGTSFMEPQAPIRTTAGEVFAFIEFFLPEELASERLGRAA